ncbi:hypothetical protein [Actinomadura sp. NTSP31]|uniref:hypothetical protein n=1 Tax=Actinomadura sp. NTSP31 TaxID=1735447 RepID=UPI0035BEF899
MIGREFFAAFPGGPTGEGPRALRTSLERVLAERSAAVTSRLLAEHPDDITALAHTHVDSELTVVSGCSGGSLLQCRIPISLGRSGLEHCPAPIELQLLTDEHSRPDDAPIWLRQVTPLPHERSIVAVAINTQPRTHIVAATRGGHITTLHGGETIPWSWPAVRSYDYLADLALTVVEQSPALVLVSEEGVVSMVRLDSGAELTRRKLSPGDWRIHAIYQVDDHSTLITVPAV